MTVDLDALEAACRSYAWLDDARFTAAASPTVVLELIGRLREAETELRTTLRVGGPLDEAWAARDAEKARADALEARVAVLEEVAEAARPMQGIAGHRRARYEGDGCDRGCPGCAQEELATALRRLDTLGGGR
jgi:hypothetical protein